MSALGITEVELPVANAVEATIKENSVSSGFHESLNNRWTLVYKEGVSDKLKRAAEDERELLQLSMI